MTFNPAAGAKVFVPKKAKLRERSFTDDEARRILSATLEPISGRLSEENKRARRWIPWLCAYSGARVNEFSQLRKEDVRRIDGIWTVRVTPEAGQVKTDEARTFPIHEHLIEQGFLAMVESQPLGPLFYNPSNRRSDSEGNRHVKKVGERLAEWVRKDVGITDRGIKPNHAWRHTFKSLSYETMEERMVDYIQGHTPTTVGRKYEGPPLRAMAEAMSRVARFNVPGV